jgi:hypothetical protein
MGVQDALSNWQNVVLLFPRIKITGISNRRQSASRCSSWLIGIRQSVERCIIAACLDFCLSGFNTIAPVYYFAWPLDGRWYMVKLTDDSAAKN